MQTHYVFLHADFLQNMRFLVLVLAYFSVIGLCRADPADDQAASFARFYGSYCMRRINDLDDLKRQLAPVPQLAPEGAAAFLNGKPGGAWPIPDTTGLFVLALPADEDLCAVFARRASVAKAEKLFLELVATSVPPLLVRKREDSLAETDSNGTVHTLAYEWYLEGSSRKMLFMLSTTSLAEAQIQVLGTVSIITE
jgi:hypothetical protein